MVELPEGKGSHLKTSNWRRNVDHPSAHQSFCSTQWCSADGGTSTQRLQIAEPFIHNVVLGGHRDERSVRTSFYILPTVCKPFRNARWNRQLILVEITIACCWAPSRRNSTKAQGERVPTTRCAYRSLPAVVSTKESCFLTYAFVPTKHITYSLKKS